MKRFFYRYRWILFLNTVSALFVFLGWWWAYSALHEIVQPLIIHFSDYVGINYVGQVSDLSTIAHIALVAILVNTFLAVALEKRDWFLGKFMTFVNIFLSALIFIGFAAIIAVNQ